MRGRTTSDDSVDRWSRHDWWGVVLEAPDAPALARFYSELLGWKISGETPEDAAIAPEGGVAYISFQTAKDYIPPVWPSTDGRQQMMMHLDFEVSELAEAVEHALELGATLADFQPQENVRVLRDPVGHPFCLYT